EWLPVFLSTDNVFDGGRGGYREADPTAPVNAYGAMKREVERFLEGAGRPYLNVRLGKVFTMDPEGDTLLADWHRTLREARAVRCVEGQRLNPTCAEEVADGIASLAERGARGTFHLCAPEAFERVDLARTFALRCGFRDARITVEPETAFGFRDRRPRDPTMDPGAYLSATGRRPRPVASWFEEAALRW
ncbi:MAG: sugar nucleotide-binding protein, partial [Planctomycetes bacterium]|nr:sugar nucleotide-binding protein [Planctomycetota bacterium]